jgi:hypothetical protein
MKSTVAHYLLLIYITAMCKPVLPLVNDILAHTFWKTQHIITVHHENGKDHLHYELKKISDQNNEDADSSAPKSAESVSVHILLQNNYDFSYSIVSQQKHLSGSYSLLSTFLELNPPPPKA